MDIRLQNQLTRLCKFPVSQKWELKYRASIDGFESNDFHSHCDGIANTLTVIKAKGGNIFGGFTEKQWHSRSQFVTDSKAFIFSLVNKEEKPFKVMSSNEGKQAICCNPAFGPCFGGEGSYIKDICVLSDSNFNKKSNSNLGYGYQHPDYVRETDRAQNILAGSNNFEIEEIEIFTKTN
jgi:hypothetical protein